MRCSGTTVTLPRLGTIRTHETTEALARKLAEGRARILSATVSRSSAGSCPSRWRSTVTSPIGIPGRGRRSGSMSVSKLVTAVDHRGRVIQVPGPRPLRTALRRLRRACRAHSRKQKGSANRRKSARRLARLHARITNCPSSKTCSACGMVKAKLSLTERVFRCERCGLVIDRDVNAAKNLFMLAVSGRGPGGAEVRGPHEAGLVGTPVRPSVMLGTRAIQGVPAKPASRGAKQEPGAAQAGKTGPPGNWWL
jgi:hypothetical protein